MTARREPKVVQLSQSDSATVTIDPPAPVTVNIRGRDWTIDVGVMDDMDFLESIEALESGNPAMLPGFARTLLGAEQYEAAKELVRDESGRAKPAALMELVREIMSAPSSAVVPVGESSAS